MSFADVWNRTLVYFGIAEEDDEWDEDGYLTEEDLASSYSERPNVRRLTPRRRQQQDFDDWTDPEPEESSASTPRLPTARARSRQTDGVVRAVSLGLRRKLRDELQPLEQSRREHRPERDRRWGEVVLGDPGGEAHAQLGQERPVGADAVHDRLRLDAGDHFARAKHDPERLSPAELDEHGLAGSEVRQVLRDAVGEGSLARGPGRVDRDCHEARPRVRSVGGHLAALRPGFDDPGALPSRRG